jgi:DNA-binding SARP family transcriptional activator
MDSLFSTEYFVSSTTSAALSPGFLLKRGLDYVQQGDYAEGAALLTLVRTHLYSQSSQQDDLASALDAFLYGFTQYKRLQKSLHALHMAYAETRKELQTHIADLAKVLPQFIQEFEDTQYPYEQKSSSTPVLSQPCAEAVPRDMLLFITCFGQFEVRRLGTSTPLALCSSRKGQGIFRYLLAQPTHSATSDTLQAVFWPDEGPEVAQQKLHIAISALRRWLKIAVGEQTHSESITCKNALYSLAAAACMETDVDRFLHWYHSGQQEQQDEQIACYERACSYYTGPFLPEDRYADWSFLPRERLSQLYLGMCRVVARHYVQVKRYDDAVSWSTALLKENACDESAHQLLIQSYAAQGRRSEAVQHYQHCVRLLATELGVQPLPETRALYQTLLNRSDAL